MVMYSAIRLGLEKVEQARRLLDTGSSRSGSQLYTVVSKNDQNCRGTFQPNMALAVYSTQLMKPTTPAATQMPISSALVRWLFVSTVVSAR